MFSSTSSSTPIVPHASCLVGALFPQTVKASPHLRRARLRLACSNCLPGKTLIDQRDLINTRHKLCSPLLRAMLHHVLHHANHWFLFTCFLYLLCLLAQCLINCTSEGEILTNACKLYLCVMKEEGGRSLTFYFTTASELK